MEHHRRWPGGGHRRRTKVAGVVLPQNMKIGEQMAFSDGFLEALGAWQRGWREDRQEHARRAADLEREAASLDPAYCRVGGACYRKYFLRKSELVPLFFDGVIDEGAAAGWTTTFQTAVHFKGTWRDGAVTAAIFQHAPAASEIVVNIPTLWASPDFIAVAERYAAKGGTEAAALFNFRDTQQEVVLRTPLRLEGIVALSGNPSFEQLCAYMQIDDDSERDTLYRTLIARGIYPDEPRFVFGEGARRPLQQTLEKWRKKLIAVKRANPSKTKKGNIDEAVTMGVMHATVGAKFEGWKKLRGKERVMEGRWSDGTVVYRTRRRVFPGW